MSSALDKGIGTRCELCMCKKEIQVLTEGRVRLKSERKKNAQFWPWVTKLMIINLGNGTSSIQSLQKPEVRTMFKSGNAVINHENHHCTSCSSIPCNTVCMGNLGYTHFFLTADWLKSRVKWLPLASPNWWAPWTSSGSSSFAQTTC